MKRQWICFFIFFLAATRFVCASPVDDGLAAYYQRNWKAAAENFRKALDQNPNNSLALVYYVVSTVWDGTFGHEMRNLEDALVDNPDDQRSDIQLSFFYYTRSFLKGDDPESALSELRHAARMGASPLVHTGLGIIYFDRGNFTRAQKEFGRAMDMNPKDAMAYEYMGRILLTFNHNPKDALDYFKQEVQLAPNYPDSHYYFAATLDELGEANTAIAEYQKTIVFDPLGVGLHGMDARLALGDLYAKVGDFENAKKTYEEALELDPNSTTVKRRLADLSKQEKTK